MAKKIALLFSVLAFASVSSVALACGTSCCSDKGGKGDAKTEIVSESSFNAAGCGGGSCSGDKGGKKA